jgi:hypothetical protein
MGERVDPVQDHPADPRPGRADEHPIATATARTPTIRWIQPHSVMSFNDEYYVPSPQGLLVF